MKKIVCAAFAIICLSACSSNGGTKTMTCALESKNDSFTIIQKNDYKYKGSKVTKLTQTVSIETKDDTIYKALEDTVKSSDMKTKVKDMKGISYTSNIDKDTKKIKEVFTFDLTKVSGKDYASFTNSGDTSDKPISLDINKTKDEMEKKSGMTCTK